MKTKYNILISLLIFLVNSSFSATLYSINDGKWSEGKTWSYTPGGTSCECTPVSLDNVYIKNNVSLTLDLTGGSKIAALLNIGSGAVLDGTKNNLDVGNGGILIVNGTLKIADLTFSNSSTETIGQSGLIQVFGNFFNKNNNTGVTIDGTLHVDGSFTNGNGASINGNGVIYYNGSLTNDGYISGLTSSGTISLGKTLPINLVSFKIKCTATGSLLSWTTAAEINNNYFTIEKSNDMLNWKISTTISGAFNSNELLNYEFLDNESNEKTTYYRLKQTDVDGSYKYFDALSIICKLGNNKLDLIGLNASEKKLNLIVMTDGFEPVNIQLTDLYGRALHSSQINPVTGGNIINIFTDGITPGVYIVNILQNGNKVAKKIYIS